MAERFAARPGESCACLRRLVLPALLALTAVGACTSPGTAAAPGAAPAAERSSKDGSAGADDGGTAGIDAAGDPGAGGGDDGKGGGDGNGGQGDGNGGQGDGNGGQGDGNGGQGDGNGDGGRAPSDAEAMAGWAHYEGKHFTFFIPNADWQVAEAMTGVDISSPTGDAFFSYACAYGGVRSPTIEEVRDLSFEGMGASGVTLLDESRTTTNGAGGSSRTVEFEARRAGARWHGTLNVDLYPPGGFCAQAAMSEAGAWGRYGPVLALIGRHTVVTNLGGFPT